MTSEDLERLRQFFGAYFHQDWDLDAPDADGILERFVADQANRAQLAELADVIDSYAESYQDDAALELALVNELWCQYRPSATRARSRDWLHDVAARLRAVTC